nr:hypothetical protein [Tanacetum cinerariifolium]
MVNLAGVPHTPQFERAAGLKRIELQVDRALGNGAHRTGFNQRRFNVQGHDGIASKQGSDRWMNRHRVTVQYRKRGACPTQSTTPSISVRACSINPWMLLHQLFALGFELGNLGVDVLDFLLDVVVQIFQQFLGFFDVGSGRRRAAQWLVGGLFHRQASGQANHCHHHQVIRRHVEIVGGFHQPRGEGRGQTGDQHRDVEGAGQCA